MTVEQFRGSLCRDDPPTGLDFALVELWWDAKGDWTKAHESTQQDKGPAGSWVHAYLHRICPELEAVHCLEAESFRSMLEKEVKR